MLDVAIVGGTVVDGSGAPGYRADVGIVRENVEAIGDLSGAEARRTIDAAGMTVAPGFIDTHTHSEGALLVDPQHANALRQGITTLFLGIDGMSYAPLSHENYLTYRHWLSGLLGEPPEHLDMSSVAAFRGHYHKKVAVNTAYLVPHGTVRFETVGFRDAPLRGDDLQQARRLVEEGIEQGAVGFSTGSSYYPGAWGDTDELIELCRTVEETGAVYMSEPRSANPERAYGGGGVPEALEIARRSGVKLHFAHYRTGPRTAGKTDQLTKEIDEAKAGGADITLDIYPYASGSTIPISFLPGYAQEGGPDAIVQRLGDPVQRKRIIDYLDNEYESPDRQLEATVISYFPKNVGLEGMSLLDIAEQRGVSPGEAILDVLLEGDLQVGYVIPPPASVGLWRQVSRDSMELLARTDYMVCSDITPAGTMPHPRSYGAFPRFLGRLRRQFGVLSLEQMVQRMTDNPARRFGLSKRGRIERGYFADVVVFDAEHVIDTATYDDPMQFPIGIPFVLVNGQIAVDHERCTGVMAGAAVP